MDLYTLGGGLTEPRASLLASRGFVVLALAYYRYQGLPKNPQNLDLEYFEEALTYLRSQPEVSVKDESGDYYHHHFLWLLFYLF